MLLRIVTVALLVMGFATPSVQAAPYSFSYQFNGGQSISGELEGILQGDGNTIFVSDVIADIITPTGPYHVDTISGGYFVDRDGGGTHDTFGIVSLTGTIMDLVLHTGSHGGSCFNLNSVCLIDSFAFVGGQNVGYSSRNWDIGGSKVPEPGTLALFGLALAGLGVTRKRR